MIMTVMMKMTDSFLSNYIYFNVHCVSRYYNKFFFYHHTILYFSKSDLNARLSFILLPPLSLSLPLIRNGIRQDRVGFGQAASPGGAAEDVGLRQCVRVPLRPHPPHPPPPRGDARATPRRRQPHHRGLPGRHGYSRLHGP